MWLFVLLFACYDQESETLEIGSDHKETDRQSLDQSGEPIECGNL